jgi:hypothetical protein
MTMPSMTAYNFGDVILAYSGDGGPRFQLMPGQYSG